MTFKLLGECFYYRIKVNVRSIKTLELLKLRLDLCGNKTDWIVYAVDVYVVGKQNVLRLLRMVGIQAQQSKAGPAPPFPPHNHISFPVPFGQSFSVDLYCHQETVQWKSNTL